jgi:hypothetical protein
MRCIESLGEICTTTQFLKDILNKNSKNLNILQTLKDNSAGLIRNIKITIHILAAIKTEKEMEEENILMLMMDAYMMENGKMVRDMEKEN